MDDIIRQRHRVKNRSHSAPKANRLKNWDAKLQTYCDGNHYGGWAAEEWRMILCMS